MFRRLRLNNTHNLGRAIRVNNGQNTLKPYSHFDRCGAYSQPFLIKHFSTQQVNVNFIPQVTRSQELLDEAVKLISKANHVSALPVLRGALSLLEVSKTDVKGQLGCSIYLNLAYSYHHLRDDKSAEEYYLRATQLLSDLNGPDSRDLGVAFLNYSEFLVASLKRTEEGISIAEKAVNIIRKHHPDDCYLAAALSNYAGYLTLASRYEQAREPCSEALNIFIRELGRDNSQTRGAFSNMYQILHQLSATDAIADLESLWQSVGQVDDTTKCLSDKEISDITLHFLHTIKQAEPHSSPPGPTKGYKLYKRQLIEFFDIWQKKGLDITDPAYVPIFEQELEAISIGPKQQVRLKNYIKLRRSPVIELRKKIVSEITVHRITRQRFERSKAEWRILDEQPVFDKVAEDIGLTREDYREDPDAHFIDKAPETEVSLDEMNIAQLKYQKLQQAQEEYKKRKEEKRIELEKAKKAAEAAAAAAKKDSGKKSKKEKMKL